MKRKDGVTLIELLIVVAVLGVLLALGILFLDPSRFQTNQVASGLANNIRRIRFEAIQANAPAYIDFNTTAPGSYQLWVDASGDGTMDAGEELLTVSFGSGDQSRVVLTQAPARIGFDRRGLPVALTTGVITVASARDSSYVRTVEYFLGDVSVN